MANVLQTFISLMFNSRLFGCIFIYFLMEERNEAEKHEHKNTNYVLLIFPIIYFSKLRIKILYTKNYKAKEF